MCSEQQCARNNNNTKVCCTRQVLKLHHNQAKAAAQLVDLYTNVTEALSRHYLQTDDAVLKKNLSEYCKGHAISVRYKLWLSAHTSNGAHRHCHVFTVPAASPATIRPPGIAARALASLIAESCPRSSKSGNPCMRTMFSVIWDARTTADCLESDVPHMARIPPKLSCCKQRHTIRDCQKVLLRVHHVNASKLHNKISIMPNQTLTAPVNIARLNFYLPDHRQRQRDDCS